MKILHTSDWHIGHSLYNYDRTEEQVAMLTQIENIVREQKPDVFLLCGDVYHTAAPSAAVQTLFTEALIKIRDAYPRMTIVVTAGNHDSGTKHEIFRTPWRALGVHTIGTLNKDAMDEHIIEVPNKGFVIAVPFCHEHNIPGEFFQSLIDAVKERNSSGIPIIMTAHQTVRGCDFSGHENATEYVVGGLESFDIERFGEGYDYLALGHIHHAQFVRDVRKIVRYCGSPISVSFDENYSHSVSIVEIEKHGESPKVETIEILNPRPLVTLPTHGFATWQEAKKLLADFPGDIPAYIRLNVELKGDDFLPAQANVEAQSLTGGKMCRFCLINVKRNVTNRSDAKVLTVQEFQAEKPIDIAERYAKDMGITFDDEMAELFMTAESLNQNY